MHSETRTIPLSKGYIAIVDAEDYESLKDFPWFAMTVHGRAYAAYKPANSKKSFLMHRILSQAGSGERVFWLDGQTLNNRRSNLTVRASKKKAA
jgi:hypothetical protein